MDALGFPVAVAPIVILEVAAVFFGRDPRAGLRDDRREEVMA